jgi:hypothetical protein
VGTAGRYPGVKRGRGVTLTTHPHLVARSWMSRSYTSRPCACVVCCFVMWIYQFTNLGNKLLSFLFW